VIDVHVVFLGAVIGLWGTLLYARDTWRGITQPNRVTWLLWTVAPMLALVAELRQGVGWQWVMTFVLGVGPLLVLVVSFANHGSVWKIGPFDLACGAAAVVGLIVWGVTSNDTAALAAFMAADGLAALPTLVKSWKAPETETLAAYVTTLINALLTMATVTLWTTATVAFPLQILVLNVVFVVLIGGRIGPRLRHERPPESTAPIERLIGGAKGNEER
jgi:hypothetical protein